MSKMQPLKFSNTRALEKDDFWTVNLGNKFVHWTTTACRKKGICL